MTTNFGKKDEKIGYDKAIDDAAGILEEMLKDERKSIMESELTLSAGPDGAAYIGGAVSRILEMAHTVAKARIEALKVLKKENTK